MKVSTREWVTKAEEDFAVVNVLTRQRKKAAVVARLFSRATMR